MRLRWLLKANLIPPILYKVARGEGAERGITTAAGNWERIERPAPACFPAHPSLFRDLVRLASRMAHKHPGLVFRVRLVWLSSLPPATLLPPLLLRFLDKLVKVLLEVGKGG